MFFLLVLLATAAVSADEKVVTEIERERSNRSRV
jgi:hypothetical protein